MRGFAISDLCPDLETSAISTCPEESRYVYPGSVTPAASRSSVESSESAGSSESMDAKSNDTSHAQNQCDPTKRPSYSYNSLIAMAIQSSPLKKMRLSEIYEYISRNFPYYKNQKSQQWQNSVRHNLSLHKEFQKVKMFDGKGGYWEMTANLGTDMYISKECGKLRRQNTRGKNYRKSGIPHDPTSLGTPLQITMPPTVTQMSPITEIAQFPQIPQFLHVTNPFFLNIHQMMLQNPQLVSAVLQNFQFQNMQRPQSHGFPAIPMIPITIPTSSNISQSF